MDVTPLSLLITDSYNYWDNTSVGERFNKGNIFLNYMLFYYFKLLKIEYFMCDRRK